MATLDHGIDDPVVASERSRQHEAHPRMGGGRFCDQARQVFLHVAAARQHERMRDHQCRALFDATRKPLRDGRLYNLHVGWLDDCAVSQTRPDLLRDLVEKRVGLGAATAVIDEKERTHAADLGPAPPSVNPAP